MFGRKTPLDEEFYFTYHDRPVVKLFSNPKVNELIKKEISLNQENNIFKKELLDLLKNYPELIDHLFINDSREEIKKLLESNSDLDLLNRIIIDKDENKIFLSDDFRNDIQYEKIQEIFQVTNTDEHISRKKEIDDFLKFNRRLTHNLCNKIISIDDEIYYCGIAKIPGLWVASSIRERLSPLIVDVPRIPGRHMGKEKYYQRQQHLAESCSRQLLRSKINSLIGKYRYSLTYYEYNNGNNKDFRNLVRLTIPFNDFIIGINITKDLLENAFSSEINIVKDLKQNIKEKIPQNKDGYFIESKLPSGNIKDRYFQLVKAGHNSQILIDTPDDDFYKILKKYPNVRWATIMTKYGQPIFRYQRKNEIMRVNGADELDNLVETCLRQMTRLNVTDFFGDIQFTLAYIEHLHKNTDTGKDEIQPLTKINFEMGKYYLFTCNIDLEPDLQNTPLGDVFKFLENEFDSNLLDTN